MKRLCVLRSVRLFCLLTAVLLSCSFILSSCSGKQKRTAEDAVRSVLSLCGEAPDGVLYRAGVGRGDVGYLADSEFDLLYGEGASEFELPLVRDYAIYLSSFATPFEVAVFFCYSATDADQLGSMLLSRADTLKVFLKRCGLYETYGEKLCVTVTGRAAVLVMAESVPSVSDICRAVG